MNSAKYLVLLISGVLLVACSQDTDQAATAEPVAWIDMPLSENTWWPADRVFRTGTYQIVLDAFAGLEFKLGMNAGDMIVYEWDAGNIEPEMLLSEFHGHTERQGDAPGNLMFYSNHTNGSERGTLLAPFSGIHGWYLKNNRLEEIVVTLKVAGFYEEVAQ
ncbi:MAG: hypothetical protein Q8K97_16415 [Pseudohongiella sp.]|nr:hypothetical protein [Pseudohongiella sp.]